MNGRTAGHRLKQLLVLYESETECRQRLAALGLADQAVREVASYLSQATDLANFYERIRAAFLPLDIEVDFFEVGQSDQYLSLLRQAPANCILWNLTDGFRYYRGSFGPSLAALLGVRNFGSGPQAQHLCQDKYKSTILARSVGVRTPATSLARNNDLLSPPLDRPVGQALLVKPNTLGAKIGIFPDSKCESMDQALALSRRIWERYEDEAIVQQFIPGFDVRVSFMNAAAAGQSPQPGIYRLEEVKESATGGQFMTMQDNWTLSASRSASEAGIPTPFEQPPAFKPTMINLVKAAETDSRTAASVAEIKTMVSKLVDLFGLKDYYSVDFRISETGQVYFIEFEVCPAVTIYDFLTYLEDVYGLDFPAALSRAVPLAYYRRPDAK